MVDGWKAWWKQGWRPAWYLLNRNAFVRAQRSCAVIYTYTDTFLRDVFYSPHIFSGHHIVHLHLDEPCFIWVIHFPKVWTKGLILQVVMGIAGLISFGSAVYAGVNSAVKAFKKWITRRRGERDMTPFQRIVHRYRRWKVIERTKANSESIYVPYLKMVCSSFLCVLQKRT